MRYDEYDYKTRRKALEEDPAYRAWIMQKLCSHLREGFSVNCFGVIARKTLERCIKNHPNEFDLEEIESAIEEGQLAWEKLGRAQARGECLGNSRTWFYNMCNRYNWSEKSKVEAETKQAVCVQVVNYA